MLDKLVNLQACCRHFESPIIGDTSTCGELALVAIGNPLVEKDSPALKLTKSIHTSLSKNQICEFFLDGNFAWLREILSRHRKSIILDSVEDEAKNRDYYRFELTPSVIEASGSVIKASHSLSWLDELKLCTRHGGFEGQCHFFGIVDHELVGIKYHAVACALENLITSLLPSYSSKEQNEESFYA